MVKRALTRFAPVALAAGGMLAFAVWGYVEGHNDVLLATTLALPIVSVVLYRRSLRASLEARLLALTDRVTGLGNDHHFTEQLQSELEEAERRGHYLTLCLLDVDDFKRVNDRFGHVAGDRVLAEVAGSLRGDGEGFRLGGDEFALLLPRCSEEQGLEIAQAVIDRVRATEFAHGQVTVSAGVATYMRHTIDREELVHFADAALYWAKGDGKNCARAYRHDLGDPPVLREARTESGQGSLLRAAAALAQAACERGLVSPSGASAVGNLAAKVARRMGFSPEHVELIRVAGTLNDIGKLALPDELLTKEGPLTKDERRALERHAQIGYEILDSLGVDSVATWVLHHHERWDGAGYPEHLAGERIPLGSRILFVADAYEAMTTEQAWRPRLTRAAALAELERCAGTQFDPDVVAAFVAELSPPGRAPAVVGA